MITNSQLRNLAAKASSLFEPHILIYTPDSTTQLLNDDGSNPFVKEFFVNSNHSLAIDPNWENTTIGYYAILVTINKPSSIDPYWIEVYGEKKRVDFATYETKKYGFRLLLKGN